MILEDTPERRALGASVSRAWNGAGQSVDPDAGPDARDDRQVAEVRARTWAVLVGLGVPGIGVPEALGGSGGGLTEVALVLAAAGRDRARVPLLGRALAVRTLLAADHTESTDAAALLARAGADGNVALAAADAAGDWRRPGADVAVTVTAGVTRVTGVVGHVLDLDGADTVLVVAATDAGLALVAVDLSVVDVSPVTALDPGTSLSRVVLADAPARLVADPSQWSPERCASETVVLLAAHAVGGARGALELTLEHARRRVQFGRPIGSFQAVRHRAVDLALALDRAETALAEALRRSDAGDRDFPLHAAMAGLTGPEVYEEVAAGAIQILGGLGFTWEHPAHLHLKRARTLAGLRGHPSDQLDAIADLADLVGTAP